MKQEDKGLVIRGLLLLGVIGILVAFVLTLLFWRPAQPTPPAPQESAERWIPLAVIPAPAAFPAGISWIAVHKLSETLASAPGWDIRYNAAIALARRGSPATPWPLIREMLDEKQQMLNHRVRQPDGREVYDEAAARSFMISALKAITAWHEKQDAQAKREIPAELQRIYAQVDELTHSPFMEVKIQAENAQKTFVR